MIIAISISIGFLAMLEVFSFVLVRVAKKEFQWLITPTDFSPQMNRQGLARFVEHGYDPELGWVRKPDTQKEEIGQESTTEYHINEFGARLNPGHEELPRIMSCYGDSFVFARQVNDNETFVWHLSEMTKTNVLNFGVGNYGLDQAFLRLKREYPSNRTKVVLMGVVPSTIVRILSVWKHYNEFGNIFGFKPRYILADGKPTLIKNFIDSEAKFDRFEEFLPEINKYDEFYESKFKREMIRFPYFASILSKPGRNIPILVSVIWNKMRGWNAKEGYYPPAMKVIMDINLQLRISLFQNNQEAVTILKKLITSLFKEHGQENGFIPVFLWIPQKDDILHIKNNRAYYDRFIQQVKEEVDTIDLTDFLIERTDLDDLYADDNRYGGHFSEKGNRLVAEFVYSSLIEKDIHINDHLKEAHVKNEH